MPYKIVTDGDRFCVHKKNPDGGTGKRMKCYGSKAQATAYLRALYANTEKGSGEMSKADKIKAKQRRERRKAVHVEKERLVEEEAQEDLDEMEIEEELLEEDEEKERKEKYYAEEAPMAATSWNELDEERAVMQRSDKLRSLTWDAEALVRNILYHPTLDPDEKANKVKAVGSEMASRMDSVMDKPYSKERSIGELIEDRYEEPGIFTKLKNLLSGDDNTGRSAVIVEKDARGDWRWIGWSSNNFIDFDGDILSEQAHKEYVAWLDKNQDMAPELQLWHKPGSRHEKAADFWGYQNGFLILSGVLTEEEATGITKAAKEIDLGMSLGMFIFGRDPKDRRIVTQYRAYETSILPLEKAANPFTDFEIVIKEAGMNTQEFLTLVMGEEKAKGFLEKTGLKQKQLREAEIEEKETKVSEPETDQPQEIPNEVVEALAKAFELDGLNEFVQKAKEAMERIPELEAKIAELSKDKEQEVAELLQPPAYRFAWAQKNRASQSKETVLDEKNKEDQDLLKSQPEVGWLSEAFGSTPLKQ